MLSSLILFEGTRRLSVLFSCAFCSSSRFTISCSRLMSEPADFRNSALMLHSWREALQTDVLLWVIKECIIYCITLMPFDLLRPSSTYRSPRSLRTAVIGIRHIWKFSCPLYNTGLVQGFSFPAKIKIKWQSNKWMQFVEFSPNIMISSAKLLIWCTAEGQGPGDENGTSCKSRRDLLPARFARGFNLTCSFGAYFDALWLIFEGTGFLSLPSC